MTEVDKVREALQHITIKVERGDDGYTIEVKKDGKWSTEGLAKTYDEMLKALRKLRGIAEQKPSSSQSGVKGIYWYSRSGKWLVQAKLGGKAKNFGLFTTVEEAKAALKKAMDSGAKV